MYRRTCTSVMRTNAIQKLKDNLLASFYGCDDTTSIVNIHKVLTMIFADCPTVK